MSLKKKYEEANEKFKIFEEKFPDEESIPAVKKKLEELLPVQNAESEQEASSVEEEME